MTKLIVCTTPSCVFCHALMDWLEKKDIDFEEYDMSDEKLRTKIEKKLGRTVSSVPLTLIGDEAIEGFNRPAIKRALKGLTK